MQSIDPAINMFFQISPDLLCITSAEGSFLQLNPAWETILGYPVEELLNKPFLDYVHPDDIEATEKEYEEEMKGAAVLYFINRYRCKDGSYKWIEWRGKPSEDGKTVYSMARDISQQKQQEAIRQENLEKYGRLAKNIMDVIISIDIKNTYLTYASPAIFEMTGYTEEELIQSGLQNILTPESEERVKEIFTLELQKCIEAQNNDHPIHLESQVVRKDGKLIWCESVTRIRQKKNGEYEVIGVIRNIEQRKKIEKALQEQTSRLENLIEATNVGTWEWNIQTGETLFNERWAEIIGYTLAELAPISIQTWADHSHPDDLSASDEKLQKLFNRESTHYDIECRMKHRDGHWVWVHDQGMVIEWTNDGKPLRMAGTHADISERKRMGEEIQSKYNLLRIAGEKAKFGGWVVDLDDNKMTWSDEVAIIHGEPPGYSPSVEQGINYYAPEFREKISFVFNECVEKGIPFDEELKIITSRGNSVWVRATGEAVREQNGKITYVQGSFQDIDKQKKAEIALRESEYLFRESQRAASIGSYKSNLVTGQWESSEVLDQILGLDRSFPKTLDGWLEIVHPDDRAHIAQYYKEEVIGKCKPFNKTYRIIRKSDGETRWVYGTGTVSCDEQGRAVSMIGTTLDITQNKLNEIELMAAIEKAETATSLYDFAPVGFFTLDKECNVFEMNLTAASMLRKDRVELISSNFRHFVAPASLPLFNTFFTDVFESKLEHTCEVEILCGASSPLVIQMNGIFSEHKQKCLLAATDITRLKKTEKEILETNNRLQLAQEASNSGSWDWDIVNNKLYWSDEFRKLWGLDPLVETGFDLLKQVLHPDDVCLLDQNIAEAIKSKKRSIDDYRIIFPNNEIRWIRAFSDTFYHEDQPIRMLGLCLDVTDQKKAEQELNQARLEAEEASASKSEFLSRMSHEFRTPLNAILGFGQLLEMGELTPEQKKGVTRILDGGKRLLELIKDVLDISRIDTGRLSLLMEPVKIGDVLPEIILSMQQLAADKRVTIQVPDSAIYEIAVHADQLRLKQVLNNLINNAIKYNKPGGTVTVSAEIISTVNNTKYARMLVKDNGQGIVEEDIKKLFKPFERISSPNTDAVEGTGLGLAVVKKLMNAMEGNVGVESKLGEGSTFWIELPLDESQPSNV